MAASQLNEIQAQVDLLRTGDLKAREALFNAAFDRLKLLTHKMLRGFPGVRRWEQTDDVWQNAGLRLWNSLERIPPKDARHFLSLAAQSIRCELIDLTRRYYGPRGQGKHHATPRVRPEETSGTWPQNAANDTHDASRLSKWTEFHEAIVDLPSEEQEVFNLIWYNGLTQAEVAEVLGVSLRTIKRRWQSARITLGQSLSPEDFKQDGK